jgi:hypothetical protein
MEWASPMDAPLLKTLRAEDGTPEGERVDNGGGGGFLRLGGGFLRLVATPPDGLEATEALDATERQLQFEWLTWLHPRLGPRHSSRDKQNPVCHTEAVAMAKTPEQDFCPLDQWKRH